MAFDEPTRKRLSRFVSKARAHLTEEFARQIQSDYGIDPGSGRVDEVDSIIHLDDRQRETARILRDTLDHYMAGKSDKKTRIAAIDRIVREQAFTVLNRLAALRMMEARGFLVQSIAEGIRSDGFQLYQQLAGVALGETDETYSAYLFSLFDEFAVELPALFDRFSPEGRLFPSVRVLRQLLALLNDPEIAPLWAEDETIGWIYQYFNSNEERRQMRAASQAPRNSRELAVRNQFFTPRYVVEFLTDNTLGRIWYEMTQGETRLVDECRYLVRRPNEVFLAPGEEAPEQELAENLSQEELLQQTVYIPHRPLKDPREIKMLDPACGSMHFGLYAFDLFETIYDEAWEMGVLGDWASFYADKATYMCDVPRLIIERNIHGIDIDARAVQIAGLSLWLRAQRSWQQVGTPAVERPTITRSNIVVAEPMPGDAAEQEAFLAEQFTDSPQGRIVAGLIRRVFEAMKLAGEAGSLLKIEETIAEDIVAAREQWAAPLRLQQRGFFTQPEQDRLPLEAAPDNDERFWDELERRIYTALEAFSRQSGQADSYRRRLFANDAVRGFAFIDLCRIRYDVVLMNPPFGRPSAGSNKYLRNSYPENWKDIYACFFERSFERAQPTARIGAITSSLFLYSKQLRELRRSFVAKSTLQLMIELGGGVLDNATVETVLSVHNAQASKSTVYGQFLDASALEDKETGTRNAIASKRLEVRRLRDFARLPNWPLCYHVDSSKLSLWETNGRVEPELAEIVAGNHTFDDNRFVRLRSEVPALTLNAGWIPYEKGGAYQPFYSPTELVVNWSRDGCEMRANQSHSYGTDAQVLQSRDWWFKRGLTFPTISSVGFGPRTLAVGQIFTHKGMGIFPAKKSDTLALLALLTSTWTEDLLEAFGRYRAYENSAIANLPYDSKVLQSTRLQLEPLAKDGIESARQAEAVGETSVCFLLPTVLMNAKQTIDGPRFRDGLHNTLRKELAVTHDRIDTIVREALFANLDSISVASTRRSRLVRKVKSLADEDAESLVGGFIQYLLGSVNGRWDIRHATGDKEYPPFSDPFDALPVCPPGMLRNEAGLPAEEGDIPTDYPLRISWPGILVDDDGHPQDIVDRVREAWHVIWKEQADDIEAEACGILGVDSLRDYINNPNLFFADHLSRYSKSRRYAPIYWPLTTTNGSYTLWLYYHRLSNSILYQCVNDFVDPKLAEVQRQLTGLRGRARNRDEERDLERLTDLAVELETFRKDLLELARFWRPNLNDGVQITAAPLHALFGHRQWRERLAGTWDQLKAGDYDWAHLAMSIWPSRVVPKCTEDRSLAIAHDIETLFWVEEDGQWRPLDDPDAEATRQIEMRQSPERDRLRELLASLAADEGRYLPAMEIWQSLNEGAWDHRPLGLHLYPERAAEAAFEDSTLVFPNLEADDQQLLAKRTKKNQKLLTQRLLDRGSPDLAEAVGATLANEPVDFATLWTELAAGQRDAAPLALELWPERVIGKALKDHDLAAQHGLFDYFWYDEPDIGIRQRQTIRREIDHEVERRGGDKL